MTISPFTISGIPRLIFGEGRFTEVPEIVQSFGRRALIVTGSQSFRETEAWPTLTHRLNEAGVSWHAVTVDDEPSPELVDSVVDEYYRQELEIVLAVGGGSVIDAAKAIAGLLPFGNSVMDHLEVVGRGVPYSGPALPIIAVPTTSGAGAEATKNAVISDRGPGGFKRSFRHDSLAPNVALLDPTLTYTCPPQLTAASGIDALTQLIESYVSTAANPITDALAESGLHAARDGLLSAYHNQPEGRSAMAYAAFCSGVCLAHAGLGIIHGLASPLGAFHPIPHGSACAATLVTGVKINIAALRSQAPHSPSLRKYARAGEILTGDSFTDDELACSALLSTLSHWKDLLRISGLGAYGVTESDLPAIAAQSRAKTNPVELSDTDTLTILHESL